MLVGFLRKTVNEKTVLFKEILQHGLPFGISPYTVQEVLQGARSKKAFSTLRQYLTSQKIYYLEHELKTFEQAAAVYFTLRRKGITPRNSIDILIALTAVKHNLFLLHDDSDFDYIATGVAGLKIYSGLNY